MINEGDDMMMMLVNIRVPVSFHIFYPSNNLSGSYLHMVHCLCGARAVSIRITE